MTVLKIQRLHEDAILPWRATEHAAGFDLHSLKEMSIRCQEFELVPTGIAVEIPPGYELQIRPRSGLAMQGVTVLNSPGTVDADYRGEVKVLLINHGYNLLYIKKGSRIAQAVLCPVPSVEIVEVEKLTPTSRGAGGFGSTGI